ncbi:hypothetical protein [Spirillospora sp. NPDC047279]|uniref:hypothetical protein n=1 Tax=Spirillospora sp. NPDC047279 TaxID=3155478 RepID=UPI0033E22FC1
MTCEWCGNDNDLGGPTCLHCWEELPDDLDDTPEEENVEHVPSPYAEPVKSAGIVAIVIMVLAFGGKYTFDNWPRTIEPAAETPATPTASASGSAGELGTFLASINATRKKLPDSLGRCDTVESDYAGLLTVTDERTRQAEQARTMNLDGLTDAEALKRALVDMTQVTLDADKKYVRWAKRIRGGATCTDAGASTSIVTANTAAEQAKKRFVGLWNDRASQDGLRQYAWTDF